ncbi:MAG: hypothetical protein QOI71_3625, partial [Gaiellales bacterium]|nr:hypothetical protein [Gaiellales bacterium]
MIEGSAGIGKTELLSCARELAAERGLASLVARGGELERDLPFVVVRELLAREIARADEADRRELFAGAAGLAEPVIGAHTGEGESATPDAQPIPADTGGAGLSAALHGLFWLCSNLADRRPLLLVVDDVHWADPASLRFLLYLAHRIGDLPAVLILGRRTDEPKDDAGAIEAIRREPACEVIALEPLSPAAVAHVLDARYGERVAGEFARACHATTRGNPYFVRELVLTLQDEGLRPDAEHADRIEMVRPARIADAVRARLERLPAAAIELARAVAVLGTRVQLRHAAELVGIDDRIAGDAADALAAAELLEPSRPLTFCHPIIRSAVYGELPAGRRATAHARAARMLAEETSPAENIAGHLLHVEPAGDGRVVEILREAAAISLARGAPEQAVSYLRRALAESPSQEHGLDVLRDLGAAEVAAGEQGAAARHLLAALALAPRSEHARIAEEASEALIAAARHEDAIAMLHGEIAVVEDIDHDAALRLDAGMLGAALLSGAVYPNQNELIPRLRRMRGETPGERLMLANGSYHLLLYEGCADDALQFVRRAFAAGHLLSEAGMAATPYWLAALVLIATEQYEEFLAHVDVAQREAARIGSVIGLALVLHYRAMTAYHRGLIADAVEEEREALGITARAEWLGGVNYVLATLSRALVERGDPSGGERVLGEHGMESELPQDRSFDPLLVARANVRLAQGRPADALDDLRELERREGPSGVRTAYALWAWRPIAARALAALGEYDEARRMAEEQLRIARRWGTAGPVATALRALAAAEHAEARVDLLTQARSLLEGSREGLERMHVLLELGTALRHMRRQSESREPLLEALELAERGGAALVAERARAELAATGIRRRNRTFLTGIEALTPSELRVAN